MASSAKTALQGPRTELAIGDERYPEALRQVEHPPEKLYIMGAVEALRPGLAIVGARKATPYGIGCAKRFAGLAAGRGIVVVSGGARGCDGASHEAALAAKGVTVAFLGGGLDRPYPRQNLGLFQRIVDGGGALVSEHPWTYEPLPFTFRMRNRLIAGLGKATLIVEAGLPSGTFSTADAALNLGRDILVVPGAITSASSRGSNQLIYQGATPIVDNNSFNDVMDRLFGSDLQRDDGLPAGGGVVGLGTEDHQLCTLERALLAALDAEVLDTEHLLTIVERYEDRKDGLTWLLRWLVEAEQRGLIARYPGGRYGPCVGERSALC